MADASLTNLSGIVNLIGCNDEIKARLLNLINAPGDYVRMAHKIKKSKQNGATVCIIKITSGDMHCKITISDQRSEHLSKDCLTHEEIK